MDAPPIGWRARETPNFPWSAREPVLGAFPQANPSPGTRDAASDVVQKRQDGEAQAIHTGQLGSRGSFKPVSDDRQVQHPQKHRRDILGMMGERVNGAAYAFSVGLTPCMPHYS